MNLSSYNHTITDIYVYDMLVASTIVLNMNGSFAGYSGYDLSFAVAVAVPVGQGVSLPTGYPSFLPEGVTTGQWGIMQKIRLEIVPEPTTVAVLALGAMGLLTRFRRRGRE